MLTEIKESLAAYTVKELQHINHILQYFESIGTDIPTVRKVIQDRINEEIYTRHFRYTAKHKQPPIKLCPDCGAPLVPIITDNEDTERVIGCRICRYSRLMEAE